MARFIIIGADTKSPGVMINVDSIKFMHVMQKEDKKFAVQIIFATNESYVSDDFPTAKKAHEYFLAVWGKIANQVANS